MLNKWQKLSIFNNENPPFLDDVLLFLHTRSKAAHMYKI